MIFIQLDLSGYLRLTVLTGYSFQDNLIRRTIMTHVIGQQVAELRQLTAAQLRDRYAELFGEPPRSGHT